MLCVALFAAALLPPHFPCVFEKPIGNGPAMQILAASANNKVTKLCEGQYPSSSPDGELVAFAQTKWMPDEEAIPGLNTKLCVRSTSPGSTAIKTLASFKGPVTISMPMFSPKGDQIVFEVGSQRVNIDDPQRGVYTISVKGGKPTLLYKIEGMPANLAWPGWSDKGKTIFFTHNDDLVWLDVATKHIRTKSCEMLIGDWSKDSQVSMVRVSPADNKTVAFSIRSKPGKSYMPRNGLQYIAVPGATPKPLAPDGQSWHPRWSANGEGILFYRVLPGERDRELYWYETKAGALQKVS